MKSVSALRSILLHHVHQCNVQALKKNSINKESLNRQAKREREIDEGKSYGPLMNRAYIAVSLPFILCLLT